MKLDNALSRPYDSHLSEQIDAIAEQVNLELGRNLSRPVLEQYLFQHDMSIPNGNLTPLSIRHIAEPRFRQLAREYAGRTKSRFEASNGELTECTHGRRWRRRGQAVHRRGAVGAGCPVPSAVSSGVGRGRTVRNTIGYYNLIQARLARAQAAAAAR